MKKWVRRLGAAVLVAVTLVGCTEGCRPGSTPQPPPPASPVPPAAAQAAAIVGVWWLTVNGDDGAVVTFWPGGIMGTTDPAMGVWRPRTVGPGDVEGTWEIPLAELVVTYVIAVQGDRFVGTGVAAGRKSGSPLHPITMVGTRIAVDTAALAQVVAPRVTG